MKTLKRNWLVFSKLRAIWQILTWALESIKNLRFNGLLFTKVYNVWAKKIQKLGHLLGLFIQSRKCTSLKFPGELCVMTMKIDARFEEELTCQFKIDMRNLKNFDPRTQKNSKDYTLMGCFWPKYVMFELNNVQRNYFWWHRRLMQNLK